MLNVVTGPFHPVLEDALVDRIRQAKSADPLAPLAIIVPSSHLLARVRRLLAIEHRLSSLNLHLLTFHQLALRLVDEARAEAPPLRIVDDLFFEQLVRRVVQSRLSSLAPLQSIGHSSGTWGALWSSVRDLKDAGVDPAQALAGLAEGYFDHEDHEWLTALFSLHAAVREVGATLGVGMPDDVAHALIPSVPSSSFIGSLREAVYYGFYDLTQVQLSFFEAVARTVPTTLLFPLEDHPSYAFARRFYDRYVQPAIGAGRAVTTGAGGQVRAPVSLMVQTVIGVEEEVASVCRAILDLVETNGYQFDEIGVVARTLDPYQASLAPVFDRHRIPLISTAGRPLIQEPLCKLLLQIAALPLTDWYRTTVLDVVTSPLYASELIEDGSPHYRPEQWKLVVQALRITRGQEEWRRVEAAASSILSVESGEEETAVEPLGIDPDVIGLLGRVVSQLMADCHALPLEGTVGHLAEVFRELIARRLCRDDRDGQENSGTGATRLAAAWEALDRVWARLCELDLMGETVSWQTFVELLTQAIERTRIPLTSDVHQGVMVLDAMAARGLPFKALFVIGLNEKTFPRAIREDAFLRDRPRRVLEATLGFKIDQKLDGYDEEALLFMLLCRSAGRRLILSSQRADDAGRMLAPSPYLDEAARLCGVSMPLAEESPRRLTDRVAQRPVLIRLLPPVELAQWMAITGQDLTPLQAVLEWDAEMYRHGTVAQTAVEEEAPTLTAFDGITGPLEPHWARVATRGVAPTPLERYARCPFQYFAADVLRLDSVRLADSPEPEPALVGTLCHAALRRCYEGLLPMGWPAESVTDDTVEWCVQSSVEVAAQECGVRHATGHFLLWELAKEHVAALVMAAVEADKAAYATEPYAPIAFEVEASGLLPQDEDETGTPLPIHGRIDRLDRHHLTGVIRIIDYKFKTGSAMKSEDRQLVQSAVRGFRLQPPLYSVLDIPGQPKPGQVQLYFLAPHWPTPIARATFEATAWSAQAGPAMRRTLTALVRGIREGRYFIQPDGYCDTCAFRVICRREHQASWWRAYRAEEAKAHKSFRVHRIKDDSDGSDS